jgi:hypothetical protein
MSSDDTDEVKRQIIRVKASTYTNYPTKKPNELTVDTEIGKVTHQSTDDSAQFRLQSEGTENKEFRLEADALEALKEKEKEQIKDQKKRTSILSRRNNSTENPIAD